MDQQREENVPLHSSPLPMNSPPDPLTEAGNVAHRQEHGAGSQTPESRSEAPVSAFQLDLERGEQRPRTGSTSESLQIFWQPPVRMLCALLLGLAFAMALHGYYTVLSGRVVGDAEAQQNALRCASARVIAPENSATPLQMHTDDFEQSRYMLRIRYADLSQLLHLYSLRSVHVEKFETEYPVVPGHGRRVLCHKRTPFLSQWRTVIKA